MITPKELAALAPETVATPNKSGALQHSCTVPASAVQPLCSNDGPRASSPAAISDAERILARAHDWIKDDLADPHRHRLDHDALITLLTRLRKHNDTFNHWLLNAEKELRFRS